MPQYRRARLPGGTYFFTLNLQEPGSTLLTDRIGALREAFARTLRAAPVVCEAVVVLPDHLHAIWTLPPGDSDFSGRWRQIKHRFTRALDAGDRPATLSASQHRKGEAGVWQRRFWEHAIRSRADFAAHLAYCWRDPVRHGLVARPADWPFSSLGREIRLGRVAPDWAGAPIEGAFGERRAPPATAPPAPPAARLAGGWWARPGLAHPTAPHPLPGP